MALPLSQDFLFVVSEEPEFAGTDILGLGVDGKLTASSTQVNRITVQVLERLTGRLVPGVAVDFWDLNGKPVTEKTNEKGEWTFTSKMPNAGNYLLKATYSSGTRQDGRLPRDRRGGPEGDLRDDGWTDDDLGRQQVRRHTSPTSTAPRRSTSYRATWARG